MSGCSEEENEKETPLEIEDYSCNTCFEEVIGEIERYLVEEFSTRLELQRFLATPLKQEKEEKEKDKQKPAGISMRPRSNSDGEVVLGRNFVISHPGGYSRGGGDGYDDEGIAVEIHIQCESHEWQQDEEKPHPIARLFALPIFFLARGTTTAASYRMSESSFYLSLLTTAVSRAMRGPLLLSCHKDHSCMSSSFFYGDRIAPCFVSVGDHYQLSFKGVSPPLMMSKSATTSIRSSSSGAANKWELQQLITQPVIKYRFHSAAYPHPPEWCEHVSDQLDVFRLQIGTKSRVQTDVFDGTCVSIQRTFCLRIPRRFGLNNCSAVYSDPHTEMKVMESTLVWYDILELENETMILSVGPMTFPFGTGTAPLRGIHFSFYWNRLLDTEVHDDEKSGSNINPFSPTEMNLQNKLTIKARAIPKKDCELNHTACKGLSEYVYRVTDYIVEKKKLEEKGGEGEKEARKIQEYSEALSFLSDEILYAHTISVSGQQDLINRLTKYEEGTEKAKMDIRRIYFPGSLLCRFAYICANRVEELSDIFPLWLAVVDHLKNLLECEGEREQSLRKLIEIIGVPDIEEIDHGFPLLVQKLQFLSYCARHMLREGKTAVKKHPTDGWDDDVEDLGSQSTRSGSGNNDGGGDSSRVDDMMYSRHGYVVSKKRLITNGEPLIEPKALPTPPCTSDVMMMKAQELENLGTASAGQNTRAWMQSEALFNDMCLFLYFNRAHEGRVVRFPDFVQWHSPRDFIPPSNDSKKSANYDDDDDNAYLSERMRRHSTVDNGLMTNIWWPLWEKATPRSPEEIIAQTFSPHEQAQLIIRWMEKGLSFLNLLIETVHANFSNSLHRVLSHRCIEGNRAMAAYARSKNESIMRSLKDIMHAEENVYFDTEYIRTIYCSAIRVIGEIETSLCAALGIERVLGGPYESSNNNNNNDDDDDNNISSPLSLSLQLPTGEPCTSVKQLVSALSSPLSKENEDCGELVLCEASLSWDVWRLSGIMKRFTEDDQAPIALRLRATCMAERPLNTTACFQQMIAETDEAGVFRVALTLAEEVL